MLRPRHLRAEGAVSSTASPPLRPPGSGRRARHLGAALSFSSARSHHTARGASAGARRSSRRNISIASRSPATRLANAASASGDSAGERNVASVSSRPCQRTAARSSFSGFCSARRSREPSASSREALPNSRSEDSAAQRLRCWIARVKRPWAEP
jgi:hypothetical protein